MAEEKKEPWLNYLALGTGFNRSTTEVEVGDVDETYESWSADSIF